MRIALLAMALALAACAPTATAPPAPIHLSGTSWIRTDDENASPHNATAVFEDARASGYSGCQPWFAPVTQDGERIHFGHVGITRMACAEPAEAAQRNFLSALSRARYAHYDQDSLVLLDANQHQVARFERDR